jgi:hypothetical protein
MGNNNYLLGSQVEKETQILTWKKLPQCGGEKTTGKQIYYVVK